MISFEVTIENSGEILANMYMLSMYVDDQPFDYINITSTPAKGKNVKIFTWQALEGKHGIVFMVDSKSKVAEKDETNNRAWVPVEVKSTTWSYALSVGFAWWFILILLFLILIALIIIYVTRKMAEDKEEDEPTAAARYVQ